MLDNKVDGNSQAGTGAAEQPTSPTSPAGSQQLPDYVTALQSQVEQLTGMMKGLQKGTDKQIGQVRGDIKRILELGSKGLDEGAIQRELFIDQMMNGQPQNAPAQPPAGSEQKGTSLDVDTVVASLQFQPNDPALAALKIKFSSDPQGLVKAAADLRLSQLQTPNPSPATLPSVQGNLQGISETAQAKIDRLQELQKSPSKNRMEIIRLTAELEASGWK